MAFELIIKPEAEDEINQAVDWYEGKQLGLGYDFLIHLQSYFDLLKTEVPIFELKRMPSYRELPLGKFPYVIIYELLDDTIIIYSVFNTSQNPIRKRK
ncbi:MAG TPA: type II toxin-antitoxin system RelE/ParE family toxin [Aequorivita sp.]|nr:type II toxin-antitoxin system RelE/ParE family toxin [Aequorivita sp.]